MSEKKTFGVRLTLETNGDENDDWDAAGVKAHVVAELGDRNGFFKIPNIIVTRTDETVHLVIQQGGTSMEWYPSWYDSDEEAQEAIKNHAEASYNALGPYAISAPSGVTGDDLDKLLAVIAATIRPMLTAAVAGDFANPEEDDDGGS